MALFGSVRMRWRELMNDSLLKAKIRNIIFDADTTLGRLFDVILISFIVLSVLIVIFETAHWIPLWLKPFMHALEWLFTAFFTVEYLLRLYCTPKPRDYSLSFFGIVDFLSTFPAYLAVFFPSMHGILVMRMFRLMRVFRIFKLFDYMNEGHYLLVSLKEGFHKIIVFFLFVVVMVVSIGTVMFIVENGRNGDNFTSIPNSIYWATVTMTTVGYGDIAPVTTLGRFLAGVVMLIGYTVLAVPTGIFTVSMVNTEKKRKETYCPNCGKNIDRDSRFCKHCGYDIQSKQVKPQD